MHDNVDKYSKAKFDKEFKFNSHIIIFGVVYMVFLCVFNIYFLLGVSGGKKYK